ncbi:MAG: hypothetical protein JNM04_00100 [Chthonomonas sp.]|nr:hypothetical protein [Chthonomonas sp.]
MINWLADQVWWFMLRLIRRHWIKRFKIRMFRRDERRRQMVARQDQIARRYGRQSLRVMLTLLIFWWLALAGATVILHWIASGGIDIVRLRAESPARG